jgi:hypothetical protein
MAGEPECGFRHTAASRWIAYPETPKRNALRCARLAMTCLDPVLHESWQDFLIFVWGEGSSMMMMAKRRIAGGYPENILTGFRIYGMINCCGKISVAGSLMYTRKTINMVKVCGALLIVMISALTINACSDEVLGGNGNKEGGGGETSTTKYFWAHNLTNNGFYSLKAELLAKGRYCKVWVEQDSLKRVSSATARKIANEYDNQIYVKMMAAFNIGQVKLSNNDGKPVTFSNIMEFADWLTDGDGKLSILMLDIKDGYTTGGGYTAGYFWAGNFLDTIYRSNKTDMIYLDTYPAEPDSERSYQTLAHEMQHLMNFVTSVVKRVHNDNFYLMDTWVDEGLSSAAEYLYPGKHVEERYGWFNTDREGTIALGNNFFVWGNLNNTSILDEYATVYLFFQWLRIQSGESPQIYKNIIASENPDYRAVTAAANNISWFTAGSSWQELFETWLAANYINAGSGRYGYNNDPVLKDVQAKTAPAENTTLQLLPGEAVYSRTDNDGSTANYSSNSGANIRYAGLKKDSGNGEVSNEKTYSGGVLLTYNINTENEFATTAALNNLKENGNLTGIAEETSKKTSVDIFRSSIIGGIGSREPVSIDARDMLARNGYGEGQEIFYGVEIFNPASSSKNMMPAVEVIHDE